MSRSMNSISMPLTRASPSSPSLLNCRLACDLEREREIDRETERVIGVKGEGGDVP